MAEDKALVVRETGEIVSFDRGPISIVEAKKRIEENQKNAIEILEEGTDWVRVPGISKPLLAKPAAEKLSRYAGVVGLPPVQAHYEILEREADPFLEWDFEKKIYEKGRFVGTKTIKTRGFYRYRVRCVLSVIGTEIVVGDKIGVCSSSDPGKETAMENTVLQQAQVRANRQAVMAYIGISDRFTEEEAGDEVRRRKETVGTTKDQPKGKATTASDDSGFRMPFGKHKGELLVEIPLPYLQWCLDNMDGLHDETREIIKAEVKRDRNSEPDPKPDDKTQPEKSGPTREALLKEIPELERECATLYEEFKPLEARDALVGTRDLTKGADDKLVKYRGTLIEKIKEANA